MKALFVIGPSGSGKSTLCSHLCSIYRKVFEEDGATLVNLDPGNDHAAGASIDINQLITVEDIMEQLQLGPNGSIIYSIQFLYENIQWLTSKLKQLIKQDKQHIFIFDFPGQIQLYIHSNCLKNIINTILKQTQSTACILELFDCTYLQNIQHYVSLCMMSLTTMINLEMPHINLLNKVDLLKSAQNRINRGLINQYFSVPSMAQLVQELDYTMSDSCKPIEQTEKTLEMIAKVIDTYGQVSFMPCSLYKANLITNLLYELQKVFGSINESLQNPKFYQIVKQYDMFSHQRAITELQEDLNRDEEEQLEKMHKDMKN